MLSRFSCVQLFETLWTVLSLHTNTGVGYHSLFQGIFLAQGSDSCLMFPAMAGRFFTASATLEAYNAIYIHNIYVIYNILYNTIYMHNMQVYYIWCYKIIPYFIFYNYTLHIMYHITYIKYILWLGLEIIYNSVQFSHSVMSDSLWLYHYI